MFLARAGGGIRISDPLAEQRISGSGRNREHMNCPIQATNLFSVSTKRGIK